LRAIVNGTGILLESSQQKVFKHPQPFLGRTFQP
jgi:hypothetical protein